MPKREDFHPAAFFFGKNIFFLPVLPLGWRALLGIYPFVNQKRGNKSYGNITFFSRVFTKSVKDVIPRWIMASPKFFP
jgi:hypothetical protein